MFLLALAGRSFYLYEGSRSAQFDLFYMDEQYNLEWARALATGEWSSPYDELRDQPCFRAPLYSHFLAGLLILFNGSTLLARVFQAVLGAVSCALCYGLGLKCFGRRVGVLAGLLSALYWVFIYFDGEFLLPVLLVFLLLVGFLVLRLAAERRSAILAAVAGLAFGLYSITRPNILPFFPLVFWWAGTIHGPRWRGRAFESTIRSSTGP